MTEKDYMALFAKQGGLCAICGQPETATRGSVVKNLAIDHDHKTGKIRGLLCQNCNTALGKFKDSPELLASAIAYVLRKNKAVAEELREWIVNTIESDDEEDEE